jgi:Ca2+-binding EF-hand superfamily protein
MKKINITFSEEETESLIRDADIDGDGCITYK